MQRLTASALALALSGCASVAPTVPADVARTSTALEVHSANELLRTLGAGNFSAGPYQVSRVDQNIIRGEGFSVGSYQQHTSSDRFAFSVAGPRATWLARCARMARARSLSIGRAEAGFERSRLQCTLSSGAEQASVELDGVDDSLSGVVQAGGATYRLDQYFQDAGRGQAYLMGPQGLRIDGAGRNAAAVELSRRPENFWLDPSLAPATRDALAAALAALLIDARRR